MKLIFEKKEMDSYRYKQWLRELSFIAPRSKEEIKKRKRLKKELNNYWSYITNDG